MFTRIAAVLMSAAAAGSVLSATAYKVETSNNSVHHILDAESVPEDFCQDLSKAFDSDGPETVLSALGVTRVPAPRFEIPYAFRKENERRGGFPTQTYVSDTDLNNDGVNETVFELSSLRGHGSRAAWMYSSLFVYFEGHPYRQSHELEDLNFFLYGDSHPKGNAALEDRLVVTNFPRDLLFRDKMASRSRRVKFGEATYTQDSDPRALPASGGHIATDVDLIEVTGKRFIWLDTTDAGKRHRAFLLEYLKDRSLRVVCFYSKNHTKEGAKNGLRIPLLVPRRSSAVIGPSAPISAGTVG